MDFSLRIAAQAKAFLIEHPDLDSAIDKGVKLVSWGPMALELVGGAFGLARESHIPFAESVEFAHHIVETVENSDVTRSIEDATALKEAAEYAVELEQLMAESPSAVAVGGPEVESQLALEQAWQAERDVLLEKQASEIAGAEGLAAQARQKLEDRTAGFPEQQQRLDSFDDTFAEYKKDMADRHGAEVRELDDKWQEKFHDFEHGHGRVEVYPEHVQMTDPERDRSL